jgi:hypothetical protein
MRAEAVAYRAKFPLLWRNFLHAHFDSPEAAAAYFAVDGTTAKKWWAGLHAPVGSVVGYAFETMFNEAREYLIYRAGLARSSEPTASERLAEGQIKEMTEGEPLEVKAVQGGGK